MSVLNTLSDPLRFFAAIESVSLKIELESDGATRSSISLFVIGVFWPAALMSLLISFESCQRFGPTCCARKFASVWLIWPFLSMVSFVIHLTSCSGVGALNSSVVAILLSFLNRVVRLSGGWVSVNTRTQKSGVASIISATSFWVSAFACLRKSLIIVSLFSARKGSVCRFVANPFGSRDLPSIISMLVSPSCFSSN